MRAVLLMRGLIAWLGRALAQYRDDVTRPLTKAEQQDMRTY